MLIYNRVIELADAISTYEGYYAQGKKPQRYGNPGDLRNWPGYPCDDCGITIFGDPAVGFSKLLLDLYNHCEHFPYQDLLQFIGGTTDGKWSGYAPASDGNDPVAYAHFIGDWLGLSPQTCMGHFLSGALFNISPTNVLSVMAATHHMLQGKERHA